MIITLLAALTGAAQQAFVVYEGAESSHFVDNHPGSSFYWRVLTDFSPDTEANPADYTFISSNNSSQINVSWNKVGLYYLEVSETDLTGCSNRKVTAINVVSNTRSIAFISTGSAECYDTSGNGFVLPLSILGDGGLPLDAGKFPLDIGFTLNGNSLTQQVIFNKQELNIDSAWFTIDPGLESIITVHLTSAQDQQGVDIPILQGSSIHVRAIHPVPQIDFVSVDSSVNEFKVGTYIAGMLSGEPQNAVYRWTVDPPYGTSTDLTAITGPLAEIQWEMVGRYTVGVSVTDGNGCTGDTITQLVKVNKTGSAPIPVTAGPDTIIGSCQPYQMVGVSPTNSNYTYSWEPTLYLSDPNIPAPVFTPGKTTTYVLTVSNSAGTSVRDTVTITVNNVSANAGSDVMMENGSTVMLDASLSSGRELSFLWTTENGIIDDGATTDHPVVSQPGTYNLEVTDAYGCSSTDSVVVSLYANAPVANDDYDTTNFQTQVSIDVLANDSDPDGDLDPSSLHITNNPVNGVADVNYVDHTILYTPNKNFTGTDIFEYEICDLTQLCDNAKVYVLVTAMNFLIPEAFTPNGDNINDFFEILGIEYYPNNKMTIINRWGKKVYEAKAYGIDTNPKFWDGKSNVGGGNGDLPTGTYFYVLDLGNGEKPIAGSVYIDR